MIAALLKIVVGIIVSIAVVLVFALVYNSFYFSSEPLLMTSEHVERGLFTQTPWRSRAATVAKCRSFFRATGKTTRSRADGSLTASW